MRGTLLVVGCAVAVLLSSQMNAQAQRRSELTTWMRSFDQRLARLEADFAQLRQEMQAVQTGRAWDGMQLGMTPEQVGSLIGRPERLSRNMEQETWYYAGGASVAFDQDQVVAWQAP